MSGQIPERQLVDDIAALEDAFAARHGYPPENVSHWDPGEPYRAAVTSLVPVGSPGDLIGYIFSDEVQAPGILPLKLGFDPRRYASVVTPNGTTAISLLLHHFSQSDRTAIRFLGPVYFSAVHLARRLGIRHSVSPLLWTDGGGFSLRRTLEQPGGAPEGVLWVTNPVYGTGCRLADEDVETLRTLVRGGRHTVVVDEAYATEGQRIGPALAAAAEHDVFGIYCPHKTVNVNGLKFAAVVAPTVPAAALDQLTDVVCGGLTPSNRAAMRHYSSDGFADLVSLSQKFVDSARDELPAVVPTGMCSLSSVGTGPFVTVNNPRVPAELGWDVQLLGRLAEETGATFIPTCRNWMSPATGLGFRVNLCRASPRFWQSLARLCHALNLMGADVS